MSVKVEVKENNKLIARFMGATFADNWHIRDKYLNGTYFESITDGRESMGYLTATLEYHDNWSWLMPVIEKIESLGYTVTIKDTQCEIDSVDDAIYGVDSGGKLSSTYECIIDFIQWYNTKNNTQ